VVRAKRRLIFNLYEHSRHAVTEPIRQAICIFIWCRWGGGFDWFSNVRDSASTAVTAPTSLVSSPSPFASLQAGFQVVRVVTTILPGISVVNLLWKKPFSDNTYAVVFSNPPYVLGGVSAPPAISDITDAFPGSSLGENWAVVHGTFAVSSESLSIATVGTDNRATTGYTDSNWGLNQYAQVTLSALPTGTEAMGPAVCDCLDQVGPRHIYGP
jgi:hypothetical protein